MPIATPAYMWIDGEPVRWEDATVHASELGWSTVGAVFEGIRGYWNEETQELQLFRLDAHLERLARSMRLVRLPLRFSIDELSDAIADLVRRNGCREDTYVFPLAFLKDGFAHRQDQAGAEALLHISTRPMPTHLGTDFSMTCKVSSWRRISDDVMPPRIKNLSNYRNGQLARSEARLDGYDNAIFLNTAGKVAEAPGACIVMIKNGEIVTPDVTSSILESITRSSLLHILLGEFSLQVVERDVDRTELYLADEVFLCGTAAEVTPVVEIDRYPIGSGCIGKVTRRLSAHFREVVHGSADGYDDWLTPVPLP